MKLFTFITLTLGVCQAFAYPKTVVVQTQSLHCEITAEQSQFTGVLRRMLSKQDNEKGYRLTEDLTLSPDISQFLKSALNFPTGEDAHESIILQSKTSFQLTSPTIPALFDPVLDEVKQLSQVLQFHAGPKIRAKAKQNADSIVIEFSQTQGPNTVSARARCMTQGSP